MDEMIDVGIIDDERFLLDVMGLWLANVADIQVVTTAQSVDEYLSAPQRAKVVVLDLKLDDGSDFLTNITTLVSTGHRVIVFSVWAEHDDILAASHAGADAYLLKRHTNTNELTRVIREIADGGSPMTTEHAFALSRDTRPQRPDLSVRQRQVLEAYGSGSTLTATARRLGVAEGTVKEHLARIKQKYADVGRPIGHRGDYALRLREDGHR